jgi:hypothetical protein
MLMLFYKWMPMRVADSNEVGRFSSLSLLYVYRLRINYWRILQNHIFTNTEQKYMMLLPFESGMFAVS